MKIANLRFFVKLNAISFIYFANTCSSRWLTSERCRVWFLKVLLIQKGVRINEINFIVIQVQVPDILLGLLNGCNLAGERKWPEIIFSLFDEYFLLKISNSRKQTGYSSKDNNLFKIIDHDVICNKMQKN